MNAEQARQYRRCAAWLRRIEPIVREEYPGLQWHRRNKGTEWLCLCGLYRDTPAWKIEYAHEVIYISHGHASIHGEQNQDLESVDDLLQWVREQVAILQRNVEGMTRPAIPT